MSEMIATHTVASLSFDDTETATQHLRSMTKDRAIVYSEIRDVNQALFTSFGQQSELVDFQGLLELGAGKKSNYSFTLSNLYFSHTITLDGFYIGRVNVKVSLNRFWSQLLLYLSTVFVVVLVLYFSLTKIASRIKKEIAIPIDDLLNNMGRIKEADDYSIRIDVTTADEIGQITSDFNEMIERIEFTNKELKEQKKKVEMHAFFDVLTGLPNRRLLSQQLSQELKNVKRNNNYGALIYIDLDHFKTINDSLGHDIGDELLKMVSGRLKKSLRGSDICSRIGGDEFIVVLSNVGLTPEDAADNALTVADNIRLNVSEGYCINGRPLHSTASIGISLFNSKSSSAQDVIKQADMAMYEAKNDGRNASHFFSSDMQVAAICRLNLEEDLRVALEPSSNQLELFYQPQVEQTGNIVGAEALIRWHHPEKGLVMPEEFIPLAETTGLIVPLGEWVIDRACLQLSKWQAAGENYTLAVNVSPKQFLQEDFVDYVSKKIKKYAINAELLEIEITESLILEDKDSALNIMNSLRSLGVFFSIDDFGTGYSSLQYLTSLPISKLKIDQSFVRDILVDRNDAVVVITIISMTQHLGMKVIAEGVETIDELNFLKLHGCNLFQGYYFSKPKPIKYFAKHLISKSDNC